VKYLSLYSSNQGLSPIILTFLGLRISYNYYEQIVVINHLSYLKVLRS